ncbi:SUMF1/EgtB/PvdO family nonheme iron enzyme [Chitinilyticum aquatile]|uniref:SUMF1/EgtB/PvdO family nonheme iron enzyme n=1 Tax=Chitinilyticum aquatile TaxID=362520 RepID=UPI00041C9EAB|nr:SUMF1/EgtB/PvdO family nonheme iron enzyme [Chitinilyticum aquatile]
MARYGFFIGINPYQDPNIGVLKCAENDARELTGVFQHKLGFQTTYIEERDAPGILEKLQGIERKLQAGDTFLFYFSGHGIQHADEQYFLLPKARLTHLDAGLTTDTLPWKALNLYTENEHWRDVHRIFIFDACRAALGTQKSGGALPSFKGEAILRKPVLASSQTKAANAQHYPLTIINSCSDGQCALELIDAETGIGKGSFTAALLDEMEKAIKTGRPFEISPQSMDRIGYRIRQRTEAFGLGDHVQSPMLGGQHPVALYAPPTQAATQPQTDTIQQLLQEFDDQLAQGFLDTPPGYNALETLNDLKRMGLSGSQRLELGQKLHAAQHAAKEQANAAEQQAELAAADAALAQIARIDDEITKQQENVAKEQAREDTEAAQQKAQALEQQRAAAEEQAARAEAARQNSEADTQKAQGLSEQGKPAKGAPFALKAAGLVAAVLATFILWPKPKPVPQKAAAIVDSGSKAGTSETFTVNGVGFKMVAIPAGNFSMGSRYDEVGSGNDELPRRRVSIQPFQLGQTEVTQELWQAVMGINPSNFEDCGASCPVENVSWETIQSFIRTLNRYTGQTFRLPSEEEWEYAARAGCSTSFNVGGQCRDKIETSEANFDGGSSYNGSAKGEYRGKTLPVASFAANSFGLYDMHGNVYEWVQDCYAFSYTNAPGDGSAVKTTPCDYRVLRGGSWSVHPQYLRAASRNSKSASDAWISGGFRLARTLP